MASAVTVIFGANSKQFQTELAKMESMAAASATKLSRGGGGSGHGPTGMTGVIRETAVIGREIAQGRGLGRILGSMSLLVQYLRGYNSNAVEASGYTQQLAVALERQALAANLAAIAAARKAEASAADAFALNLEDEATIMAADADAAKAASAQVAAVAAREKAAAAAVAAEAEKAEAAAARAATAASLPLVAIFTIVAIALAAVYGAYKLVTFIIEKHNEVQISAQKAAYNATLTFNEHAAALERLEDAALKTKDALQKLNEKHDDYAKRAGEYIKALKDQSKAQEELADTKMKGKVIDIELAEETGTISHEQAIRRKADLESQSIAEKASAKTAELLAIRDATKIMAMRASSAATIAATKAQEASDKINKSPEAIARAERLAQLEKIKKDSEKEVDRLGEAAAGSVGDERKRNLGMLGTQEQLVLYAKGQIDDIKGKMHPEELAAAGALRVASEARQAANQTDEAHNQATAEWLNQVKYSSAQVAAEQSNIMKKAMLELLSGKAGQSFGLNSDQRIGAYSATPTWATQQLAALRAIVSNTAPRSQSTNQPPGARPPQHGASPTPLGPPMQLMPNVFSYS